MCTYMQESLLGEALSSKDMHNTIDEADESEETLSLCDLPLYSDQSADWDRDFSSNSHASNSILSSSQEDYFEFFSQELTAATTATAAAGGFPPENIVFCGKLIPYKQLTITCEQDSSNLVDVKKQTNGKKKHGWRLFRWKLGFSRSSKSQVLPKNGARSTTSLMHQSPKKMYNTSKLLGQGHGRGRVSVFTASSSSSSSSSGKTKWYLFLFGISRFSPAVELRDIKSRRQSRLHCPSPPPSPPPPMFGFGNCDDKVIGDTRWGLWGLIRALSCGGNHQSTTTTPPSIGCCNLPE